MRGHETDSGGDVEPSHTIGPSGHQRSVPIRARSECSITDPTQKSRFQGAKLRRVAWDDGNAAILVKFVQDQPFWEWKANP